MGQNLKKHAKFSASAAHRWLSCPGSIALSEKAPKVMRESAYATTGTEAHECLEFLLKNRHQDRRSTEAFARGKYPADMVIHAASARDEILKRANPHTWIFSETKSDLSHIEPDMWGTADAVLIESFGRLTVVDFKYGFQVVEPENNPQLMFYALGVAHEHHYNFKEVSVLIIQPRAPHEKGTVREWVIPLFELKKWEYTFKAGTVLAKGKDAPLKSGDHCKYCPAKVLCPEISSKGLALARQVFKDELPEASTTPIPELDRILSAAPKIRMWLDAIEQHATQKLEEGHEIPGWKLVQRRSIRRWTDPKKTALEAKKVFGLKAFSDPELLSPAQFEKVFTDYRWVDKRVSNISSGVTLAPEKDPRKAVKMSDVFLDTLEGD